MTTSYPPTCSRWDRGPFTTWGSMCACSRVHDAPSLILFSINYSPLPSLPKQCDCSVRLTHPFLPPPSSLLCARPPTQRLQLCALLRLSPRPNTPHFNLLIRQISSASRHHSHSYIIRTDPHLTISHPHLSRAHCHRTTSHRLLSRSRYDLTRSDPEIAFLFRPSTPSVTPKSAPEDSSTRRVVTSKRASRVSTRPFWIASPRTGPT